MKFIVMSSVPPPGSSSTSDNDRLLTDDQMGVVIPAHRVIVAARCEYFKKALQSGMKEAIDK